MVNVKFMRSNITNKTKKTKNSKKSKKTDRNRTKKTDRNRTDKTDKSNKTDKIYKIDKIDKIETQNNFDLIELELEKEFKLRQEKEKKYGIKISDKNIKSISGPVNMTYLRPMDKNNANYLPLIILFGDLHFSKEGMCDPCTCTYDSEKCCYSLSDPAFLKLLDKLVFSEKHPIDFYIETSLSGNLLGFKGGIMEYFTTGDMISCYNHTNVNKCPTKKIRWHVGGLSYHEIKQKIDFSSMEISYQTCSLLK